MHWLIGALASPAPLSESDAQIIVSRFPCGMQPFYTTRGASRAPS